MRIVGDLADFRVIYISPMVRSGYFGWNRYDFVAFEVAFMVLVRLYGAVLFLTSPTQSQKWAKKRSRVRLGGGQMALYAVGIFGSGGFRGGGPRAGREDI